jgi:HEAT repeat protein
MLKQGVVDPDASKRIKAVHALGLAGLHTQFLAEKALTDADKQVRSEAAAALEQMHAVSARPKLRECLKDQEVQVVLACANTLYQFKDPAAYEVYYALLTGERRSHESLLQSQLDTLRDRKQVEKLAFETGIGFVPYGGAAWQAIRTVTHDDASPVRALAAARLATDPQPSTTSALAKYALDKKPQVRQAVLQAIVKRGDPSLLNTVEVLLGDENDSVRYAAAAAFISLSSRPAAKTLKRQNLFARYIKINPPLLNVRNIPQMGSLGRTVANQHIAVGAFARLHAFQEIIDMALGKRVMRAFNFIGFHHFRGFLGIHRIIFVA